MTRELFERAHKLIAQLHLTSHARFELVDKLTLLMTRTIRFVVVVVVLFKTHSKRIDKRLWILDTHGLEYVLHSARLGLVQERRHLTKPTQEHPARYRTTLLDERVKHVVVVVLTSLILIERDDLE